MSLYCQLSYFLARLLLEFLIKYQYQYQYLLHRKRCAALRYGAARLRKEPQSTATQLTVSVHFTVCIDKLEGAQRVHTSARLKEIPASRTRNSAIAEGPREALVSRNPATTKHLT